jgi:hypothetical protein
MDEKLFPNTNQDTDQKKKSPYQELLDKRTRPGLPEEETTPLPEAVKTKAPETPQLPATEQKTYSFEEAFEKTVV